MSWYKGEEFNYKSHLDSEPEPDHLIKVPKNDFRAKMTEIYLERNIYDEPLTMVFCPREVWGALPPKENPAPRPVAHPVKWVSFPDTNTESCMDPDECVEVIRQMQKDHMAAGLRDIKYNFMVGFDGIVYEGRGWHEQADRSPEQEEKVAGNAIDIGLIGDRKDQFQKLIFPSAIAEKYAELWAYQGQGDKNYIDEHAEHYGPDYKEYNSVAVWDDTESE